MSDLPIVQIQELQPIKRTERHKQGEKLRDADKVERIPVKVIASDRDEIPRKPDWIRVRIPASPEVDRIKSILRKNKLSSVCEEANCPTWVNVLATTRPPL